MNVTFLWRETGRGARRRLSKTHFGALERGRGTCSRMCSCISMPALWTRCEGSCCVCVLASVSLTCWFGRAAQELLIQQLHVVVLEANSTLLDRRTKKNERSLVSTLSYAGLSGWFIVLCCHHLKAFSFPALTAANDCEGHKVLQRHMFAISQAIW